jgi:hypothetical protein
MGEEKAKTGGPVQQGRQKYRAKIKNTSNNLLPNQGGGGVVCVWCTGASITVFF